MGNWGAEIKVAYGDGKPRDMAARIEAVFGKDVVAGANRLNVGCGDNKLDGWLNSDKQGKPDFFWNMDYDPHNLGKSGRFDVILASHVLEHVADPIRTVFYLHELLKPGGRLLVLVPHGWTDLGACSPLHLHRFTPHTFLYFMAETYNKPGTVGYGTNEGRPVADWASVRVQVMVSDKFKDWPPYKVDFAVAHYNNVVDEIHAVLTKRG